MNYQEMYKTLPAKGQKAIRNLLQVIMECDMRHPLINGSVCQSSFDTAIRRIEHCADEIQREDKVSRAPVGFLRSRPNVYVEDLRSR